MPRTIRFHLDENVAHAVADGLRRVGVDVTTTTDAKLVGASDDRQLGYAVAEARVIFTQDPDFLALARTNRHPGVTYCAQNSRSIGQIIRGLELIWEIYDPEEMQDRTEFL
jgi:predicted nuclease of predicted toxin-antitoxin system